ncbi:hypothetical protein N7478_013216 [Penicillium angulare]|uniref:uncharacterized protein n=1 Tax=Penicillium angulare TaxID=116970 RepID=UPI002540552E|nr:uncharacterized protein N7478_013216 [Penicillium angulare]KAJ5257112.1 hypothetical protein N7478_013216 [Penicillium angulare]
MENKNQNQSQQPIILPPAYTKVTPLESFSDPKYGNVTWHTLFSAPRTTTADLCAGIAVCPTEAGHLCAHRHIQPEIYHILEGEGEVTIDGEKSRVNAGATVFIPGDAEHGIVNTGKGQLRWFYVFAVNSFEEVVYRFSKDENEKPKAKL